MYKKKRRKKRRKEGKKEEEKEQNFTLLQFHFKECLFILHFPINNHKNLNNYLPITFLAEKQPRGIFLTQCEPCFLCIFKKIVNYSDVTTVCGIRNIWSRWSHLGGQLSISVLSPKIKIMCFGEKLGTEYLEMYT
jgi:hypothetical protein